MNTPASNQTMYEKLQQDILELQGFKQPTGSYEIDFGLGPIADAFPNHTFPVGAIHEFITDSPANAAATTGFMAGLLGTLMKNDGICLWISINRMIFPPGLKFFGVEPDRVIFIDLTKEKDLLWAIEESLKCSSVAAVVGELDQISFTESRRLQLAVEQSRVTGFLHRSDHRHMNTIASVSRWRITPAPSLLEKGLPGVGHPRWNVQLQKVRNGEPGEWTFEWVNNRFLHVPRQMRVAEKTTQTGLFA
jgi:protein ImuA